MVDWGSWSRHVDHVINTRGRYYGIGDGDGNPLFDLPDPLPGSPAPEQWMAAEDLELSLPAVTPEGAPTRASDLLVLDDLAGFDPSGQLPTAEEQYTLLVAMRGEDGSTVRRGGLITHTDASDPDNTGIPTEMTIHALNFADVWNTAPAVSWPVAWFKAAPYPQISDESGLEYSREWEMARVEMSTRSMFTFKHGPALFVIRRLAQESLDAVMMTQQDPDGTRWVDDPRHVVEVPVGEDTSPVISLEARDGPIWETVAGQAQNAGIILGARLYWPGDNPVRSWELANSSMEPAQVDITPSEGEPYRQIVEQEFPHPMIVMTVKEVN